MARTKVTVGPAKGKDGWDVSTPTGVQHHATKQPAVDQGRQIAKAVPGNSQLIIKGENGKIQTEHTYPRSSDPRKTPG
jgi:hypothetical protein